MHDQLERKVDTVINFCQDTLMGQTSSFERFFINAVIKEMLDIKELLERA